MAESVISNKIWNIASVLRDGGVSYGDYLEQITFLLFLKMVDENKKYAEIDASLASFSMDKIDLPEDFSWARLTSLSGAELVETYEKLLHDLSHRSGIIGEIYRGAKNRVEKASLLIKVIDMIDKVDWSSQSEDVKGDIYESLLQRIAQDTKSGAGQYFTPRALINVIVRCVNPQVTEETRIADPCCGSGGFLLSAQKYIGQSKSEAINHALKYSVFRGGEYVESTYRMCLMNLILHNIGSFDSEPPIKCQDSLANIPTELCDYVLTNPPFGKKSAQAIEVEKTLKDGTIVTVVEKEQDSYVRTDFIATTSNKQLNFVQHIKSMLKVGGTAAVVLPDNVLFEGGAGETIRKDLLKSCNLHTILRLPSGIFYAQGVKANVVFFEKRRQDASNTIGTKEVWIYDYRTNIKHTLKQNPLKEENLADFIACYNPENIRQRQETYNAETNPTGRWRRFTYDEIIARDKTSLDITWLKADDDTETDLSLKELLGIWSDKANAIASTVAEMQNLLANINEED